jgi:hypothetical protein
MEGRTPRQAAQDGQTAAGAKTWRWHDGASLLVLLLLALGLRTWLFCHTEVAARDSIGFIRMAWQLQHHPWKDVLNDKEAGQHPAYPVLLRLASVPVRQVAHGPDSLVMQYSAQLTSVLAGTLLVVPMFYLGRELFNRTVGFWASVLFQVLPASCRVLSDGLSEATFLLLAATALYFSVRGLRGRSPWPFALCGFFGGLAYLTRPEGALVVGVTGLVLAALQLFRRWRCRWWRFAACAASLAVVAVVAGSPIYLATGKLTIKTTAGNLGRETFGVEGMGGEPVGAAQDRRAPSVRVLGGGQPVFAALFAVWKGDPHSGPKHLGPVTWGLWAVGFEIHKGFHYAGWVSALLGLWWFRARLRDVPGTWVLLLLALAVVLLLWRVASRLGYVSDRHTLLVLLAGTYWSAAAVAAVGERLARLLHGRAPSVFVRLGPKPLARLAMLLLLAGLVASALPKSLEPLHTSRGGFRAAGLWLAEHARAADVVLDPYCWSNYYAGRIFQDGQPSAGPGATEYVVLDESGNRHPHLPEQKHAEALARQRGTEVYRLTGHRHKDTINIAIYAVQPPEEPSAAHRPQR